MSQQTYWTIGYAPFNRVRDADVFTNKATAEDVARKLNRTPGEYKGRGIKAVKCDASGHLVR